MTGFRPFFCFCIGMMIWISGSHAQSGERSFPEVCFSKRPGTFPLISGGKVPELFISKTDAKVVGIAAEAFLCDLVSKGATEKAIPRIFDNGLSVTSASILVATAGASLTSDSLFRRSGIDLDALKSRSECYALAFGYITGQPMLFIAGSDARGTAFGLFELSGRIGVSPWSWWADVKPEQSRDVFLAQKAFSSKAPLVAYRGIFINDEDWGLRPWASALIDRDVNNIGPKTYARVFELLLRLKANLIWPAMHPGTTGFFEIPGNLKMAEDYSIVIGSSHAEPMLRNNVAEWKERESGSFNYKTNRKKVFEYWDRRAIESRNVKGIYNLGMRGIHDSGMEGVKNNEEAASLLSGIISDQRKILMARVNPDLSKVPQAFSIYKEVLEVYEAGLKLPEDVTLIWPDDNYGYIQRLSDSPERKRSGGSGVYYHASYWGRPHDYLWLGTTHPDLIRYEMLKALDYGAKRIWVLNVGDIKPAEYAMQLFLDMAYDAEPLRQQATASQHLEDWLSRQLGGKHREHLRAIMSEYYDLAFERRPEFMGWSQTEPTRPTQLSAYQHFSYGDEASRRLARYEKLAKEVEQLRSLPEYRRSDAFYQLVYYPVIASSLMNKKFLYKDKAFLYAAQGRMSARRYAEKSIQAYDEIVRATAYYNDSLASGKWKGIMDMQPRDLPVFARPDFSDLVVSTGPGSWGLRTGEKGADELINFPVGGSLPKFFDIFLRKDINTTFRVKVRGPFSVSDDTFRLDTTTLGEMRVRVEADTSRLRRGINEGSITITAAGEKKVIPLEACYEREDRGVFRQADDYISIYASEYSSRGTGVGSEWNKVRGIGYTAFAMESKSFLPDAGESDIDAAAYLDYSFITDQDLDAADLYFYALPGHPAEKHRRRKLIFSIDDGKPGVIDFTTQGRSEQWKQFVLRNSAEAKANTGPLKAGKHKLRVYATGQDIRLNNMLIMTDAGRRPPYSPVPESR